jgi:hypothetical protein
VNKKTGAIMKPDLFLNPCTDENAELGLYDMVACAEDGRPEVTDTWCFVPVSKAHIQAIFSSRHAFGLAEPEKLRGQAGFDRWRTYRDLGTWETTPDECWDLWIGYCRYALVSTQASRSVSIWYFLLLDLAWLIRGTGEGFSPAGIGIGFPRNSTFSFPFSRAIERCEAFVSVTDMNVTAQNWRRKILWEFRWCMLVFLLTLMQ